MTKRELAARFDAIFFSEDRGHRWNTFIAVFGLVYIGYIVHAIGWNDWTRIAVVAGAVLFGMAAAGLLARKKIQELRSMVDDLMQALTIAALDDEITIDVETDGHIHFGNAPIRSGTGGRH